MNQPPLEGVITALVTPLRGGQVDYEAMRRLVEAQIAAGIDGLVPVGTTGESPTLDYEEHLDVVRAVIETARGRVPVYAGTGANSTKEATFLTREAHAAGASGFLQVAPYYNKPGPEGLYRHFRAVADLTDRPIILYSIPGRCGIEIPVKTTVRLFRDCPQVCAMKEAGGSCDRVAELLLAAGPGFTVLSGDDKLTLPFLSVGARGVISVASNVAPGPVLEMVRAARQGDLAKATAMHLRLFPLFVNLFVEANPAPIKFALHRAGLLPDPEIRLPLCELQETSVRLLEQTLAEIGLIPQKN